jgi:hypothetical protein
MWCYSLCFLRSYLTYKLQGRLSAKKSHDLNLMRWSRPPTFAHPSASLGSYPPLAPNRYVLTHSPTTSTINIRSLTHRPLPRPCPCPRPRCPCPRDQSSIYSAVSITNIFDGSHFRIVPKTIPPMYILTRLTTRRSRGGASDTVSVCRKSEAHLKPVYVVCRLVWETTHK